MSRPPRVLSNTGLYHILFRGINRQNLFEEDKDFEKMLEIINDVKVEKSFKLHAYCLMTNHVHLFICEKECGDIKKIMHKILTKYVGWFNYKYKRSGSLIGNRYKSEPIEDDEYYLTLMRYIHQNPIKAGIIKSPEEYPWSSYVSYIDDKENDIVDIEDFLMILNNNKITAQKMFVDFHTKSETNDFSISDTKKLTDEQLIRKIKKIIQPTDYRKIVDLPKSERNSLLAKLRKNGFTIGQLERLTGISRGIITRAK